MPAKGIQSSRWLRDPALGSNFCSVIDWLSGGLEEVIIPSLGRGCHLFLVRGGVNETGHGTGSPRDRAGQCRVGSGGRGAISPG